MTFLKNIDQCRLCLNKFTNLTNVILQPEAPFCDLTLPECISKFFGVEILRNDKYTKMLCANCSSLIQGISMYRRKFQDLQKLLVPLCKDEVEDCSKDEDTPPTLEPYFSGMQHNIEENVRNTEVERNHENHESVDRRRNCYSGTNCDGKSDYIRVPKVYFEQMKHPRIVINRKERELASSYLHEVRKVSPTEMKIKRMTNKYMHHGYSEGRPGVIRQLIQDRARRTMYISEFDNNIKFKSIYEYDFNLKKKDDLNSEDLNNDDLNNENLMEIDVQLNVFVCILCNNVYNNQRQLNAHRKIHEQPKKQSACEVIS